MGFLKLFNYGTHSLSIVIKSGFYKKHCFSYSLKFYQPYSTKVIYKMKSAYFQSNEENERVCVSFNYNVNNMSSTLKFERSVAENMETFLKRVQIRLQSSLTKKLSRRNKTLENAENLPDLAVELLLNNEPVPGDLKFQDILDINLNGELKLKVNDDVYDVFVNCPMVLKISLPKKLFAGTVAFAETLETQFTDEKQSEYIWYKSKFPASPKKWEKCGEGFFYLVTEDDVDYFLKVACTPKMNEKVGPVSECVSAATVVEFKALEEIKKRHEFTKEETKPDEFRIVSYNILAATYTSTKEAKNELFTFCNPEFMDFAYRKTLCISELIGYNADIICLQEVDRSHHSTLQLLFSYKNYDCFFHEKDGTREGCSFMYKKSKFNILSANQYTFSKELLNNPLLEDLKVKLEKNESLMTRLLTLPSQIQVVALENFSNNVLIVGNTHFYFHPDADHIRLLQGILSWKILQNTLEEIQKKDPNKKCSILLCGDFNSTPECGFHEFLTTGFIGSDHIDWKSKESEAIEDVSYQHSFKIKSAYDNTQYTNYIVLFKGCLDYIYYQTDHLILNQTVPIPSEEVLSRFGGIPSEFFPSDHVALIADLKFK